jgi:hypothetical protein
LSLLQSLGPRRIVQEVLARADLASDGDALLDALFSDGWDTPLQE